MVEAYWSIGKQIADVQGERAEYGKQLLKYLSEQLTKEFGAGFTQVFCDQNGIECSHLVWYNFFKSITRNFTEEKYER